MTEPTRENLHRAIDSHLISGVGHHYLVGAIKYDSLLLLDFPEDPLPLSEMIVLYNDTQIWMWWGQYRPTEPRDLLFRRHHIVESEPGMPSPFSCECPGWDHRDDANTVASAELETEPETELETDSGDGNSGQGELSAIVAKRRAYRTAQTPRTAKVSTRTPQSW